MSDRPMFPHAVDSTMMEAWRSCHQKLFRQYIEHWKPKQESVHLVAGGAFAKGVEVGRRAFFEGEFQIPEMEEFRNEEGFTDWKVRWNTIKAESGNSEASEAAGLAALIAVYGDFECPADSAKSRERTAGALEFYFSQYPLGGDGLEPLTFANGKRAIEFSFAEPLDFLHPVTGDPVLYTGRADMLAKYAGGQYVVDEKTTTQLGASWPRQWEMRSQFTGYIWAAARAGIKLDGAVVRGISILKTKYDTLSPLTYRSPYEVDRWYTQTLYDLQDMQRAWERGYWDWNLGHSCAEYGGCAFTPVCKSDHPENWLPMYFEPRVWDPLARRELTVEQWEKSWGHVRG